MSGSRRCPGGRVNVGIVLASRRWRERLRREGAAAVAAAAMAGDPAAPTTTRCRGRRHGSAMGWRARRPSGAGCRARAGRRLAARRRRGRVPRPVHRRGAASRARVRRARPRRDRPPPRRRRRRSRRLRPGHARRTRAKDVVSLLVQAFLEVPPLFDYAARRLAVAAAVRETMGLVIGDLAPASARPRPAVPRRAAPAVTETGQGPGARAAAAGPASARMRSAPTTTAGSCSPGCRRSRSTSGPGRCRAAGRVRRAPGPARSSASSRRRRAIVGEIEAIAGVFSHVYRRSRPPRARDLHFIGIALPRADRRRRAPRRDRRLDRHGAWFAPDELAGIAARRARPVRRRARVRGRAERTPA